MKPRTIAMTLTLLGVGLATGCSSAPAALTTTPVPVVPQIVPVSQFLAQANPKNCINCYLADADLIGAKLTDAWLMGATLTGANLSGAYLTGADLTGADLTAAYLSPGYLNEADLTGATLTDADLSLVFLEGADLSGADLTGANLGCSRMDGVIGADFTGALNVPSKYR